MVCPHPTPSERGTTVSKMRRTGIPLNPVVGLGGLSCQIENESTLLFKTEGSFSCVDSESLMRDSSRDAIALD
jgi:hypothetical protein